MGSKIFWRILIGGGTARGSSYWRNLKIRTALENNVISWDKYTNWLQETSTYPLIQSSLNSQEQDKLIYSVQENYKTFSHYEIWSEDLLPFAIWDNHLIILGLFPHEKLLIVEFVICFALYNCYKIGFCFCTKRHLEIARKYRRRPERIEF